MDESTGIHFHGQKLPERDGRRPAHHPGADRARRRRSPTSSRPGRRARTCTTRTTTRPTRSGAACSARSSSSRPTRPQRYDQLYGATQDIIWISNDALGGFTINGRGFPATSPIVAQPRRDDRHPVHERGQHDASVAPPRDADAGRRARRLSARVAPRSRATRWASTRASAGTSSSSARSPGAWAFHCHVLQHAEGQDGMFGMVTALVVQDATAAAALHTAGAPAFACVIPARA